MGGNYSTSPYSEGSPHLVVSETLLRDWARVSYSFAVHIIHPQKGSCVAACQEPTLRSQHFLHWCNNQNGWEGENRKQFSSIEQILLFPEGQRWSGSETFRNVCRIDSWLSEFEMNEANNVDIQCFHKC